MKNPEQAPLSYGQADSTAAAALLNMRIYNSDDDVEDDVEAPGPSLREARRRSAHTEVAV
jgi:hypothetical protein